MTINFLLLTWVLTQGYPPWLLPDYEVGLLLGHSYDIKYRQSAAHTNADGLSRLPLAVQKPHSNTEEIFYFKEVEKAPVSTVQVKNATRNNPILSAVMDLIVKGLPTEHTPTLKQAELSVQSGCLLWGRSVIFFLSLQPTVL